MSKPHIILDVGHANGTGSRGNGQEEHNLCSKVTFHLKQALRAKGATVSVLDFPELDNRSDLNKTIAAANAIKDATMGISLHMDAADRKTADGGHVIYTSRKGKIIAETIAASLCKYMPGRAAHTVQRFDLAVLNRTRAPWALIELGFITSTEDIQKLMDNPATPQNELDPLITILADSILQAAEKVSAL